MAVKEKSALLNHKGYLRFSPDLFPNVKNGDKKEVAIRSFTEEQRMEFKLVRNGDRHSPWPIRKLGFSNPASRSTQVSVKTQLATIGLKLPDESIEYEAERMPDGLVVVKFGILK